MAHFIVSRATADDIPEMVQTYNSAFEHDYFSNLNFPKAQVAQDVKNRWLAAKYAAALNVPGIDQVICRDTTTGELAGFARWGHPVILTDEQKETKRLQDEESKAKRRSGIAPYPPGSNVECCDAKFLGLEEYRDKYVDYEDMYVVYFLGVHQKYQGKGVGKLLLKHGLSLADAEGRKTYIEATDAGRRLYLKLGWKEIGLLSVDVQKWGGSRPAINHLMMRDPQVLGA